MPCPRLNAAFKRPRFDTEKHSVTLCHEFLISGYMAYRLRRLQNISVRRRSAIPSNRPQFPKRKKNENKKRIAVVMKADRTAFSVRHSCSARAKRTLFLAKSARTLAHFT